MSLGFQQIVRQPYPAVPANMTTPYLWDPFSFGGKVRCLRDRRDLMVPLQDRRPGEIGT